MRETAWASRLFRAERRVGRSRLCAIVAADTRPPAPRGPPGQRSGAPHTPLLDGPHMLGDWAAILIFVLFAAAIAGTMLAASLLVGTRGIRRGPNKTMPFESGVARAAYEPTRFSISYYMTAMLFLVFDIEIVFLYPLAVLM